MTPAPDGTVAAAALLRVHGTLRGRGRAYDGDRLVAEATYVLVDVEEPRDTVLRGGGTFPAFGEGRNVYGRLESSDPGALETYVGARLALRLEDGRQLPFTVTKATEPRVFLIHALGPVG